MSIPDPILDNDDSRLASDSFRNAILEVLRVAAALCHARGAAACIDDAPPVSTGPAIGESISFDLIDARDRHRGAITIVGAHSASAANLTAIARLIVRLIEINDKADDAARELEHIRPLTDQALVAIYSIHNGRFSYVNSRFADTLGYTREELLALTSFDELIVEEERHRVRDIVRQRLEGEVRNVHYRTKVRNKDGGVIDTEIHGSVAVVDGGRLVIGTAFDVTAQLQAEKQLRDREDFLRIITENIADVVLVVDAAGMITYISGSVENLLGYSIADREGHRAFETIHPDDADALQSHLAAFAGSDRLERAQFRFLHKNGSIRLLELSGRNLLRHPVVRGWVIDASDVTDRKRLEQELQQLDRLTSLGRLSAQVAHEFNNVMMGVQTSVDVMRRRVRDDAQLVKLADVIGDSLARGKRITGDILRFGRPAQPAFAPVDVAEFLEKAGDEIRSLVPEAIDVRLDLSAKPMHARADAAQLSQVILNLGLNARDAMAGQKGTLTIGARPGAEHTARSIGDLPNSHEYVHINVTDSGSGIRAEDLPYIFEPLFTTKRSGTGLGLSVVYQIIASHGGHIFVETARGAGTTFHLFIRSTLDESHPDVVQRQVGEARRPLPKRRVLVVEDEVAIATGLRWILEAEGMTVCVARRGSEVKQAIVEFKPDLVLLDLSLPDADGRHVYADIKGLLPVIFSTGSVGERELLEQGHTAVEILVKPYTSEELLRTIHRVLMPEGNHEPSGAGR